MTVIEDVRPLGTGLERSYQVYVRGRLKFRVKQIVYVAFSLDERVMGFAFYKEERAALVASEPHKFQMPSASDMPFNWVHAGLAALEPTEARSWSSTLGAWSCPRRSPVPTISPTPTDRAEPTSRRPGRSIGAELVLSAPIQGAQQRCEIPKCLRQYRARLGPYGVGRHAAMKARVRLGAAKRLVPSRRAPRVTMGVRRAR